MITEGNTFKVAKRRSMNEMTIFRLRGEEY